jgi:ABC-type transport system involved in multi-copper enzyme maturation permease subunit
MFQPLNNIPMKFVFIRELQDLFKDNRFWIFLSLILVITVCSGVVSSFNFQSQNRQNGFLRQTYESQLEEACRRSLLSVSFTDHLALRNTSPLMFLSGDVSSHYPNHAYVYIPRLFFGGKDSYYPQNAVKSPVSFLPFIRYDLLFIVEILFSFMMIMIVYNSISKEKETKTLTLLLSNSLSRMSVLLGKILAYSCIALFSLLLAVTVQLLVVLLLGAIPFSFTDLPQIGIFLLVSMLYLLFWIVLSVCVSASCRKSSVSLTGLIILWVVVIFIIPSSGRIFLEKWGEPLPSSQEIQTRYRQIESDMFEEAGRNNGGWRGGNLRSNVRDDHRAERNFAPVYLAYLDVLDNYQYEVASRQINRLTFLYNYSSISPSFLYHRIAEAFSNREQQAFVDGLRRYRKELMQTIMELDKRDETSFHLFFLPNYMSGKPVETALIPQFQEVERTYAGIVLENMSYIGLFLLEILVFFVLAGFLFNRSDVR